MKTKYVIIAIKDNFSSFVNFKNSKIESDCPFLFTEKVAKATIKKIDETEFDQVFVAQFISI